MKRPLGKMLATAGLLVTTAIAPMKASEEQGKIPERKGEDIELRLPGIKWTIFVDRDGKFDRKAAEEAFDKLNYEEKIPQVLEIYKDAKKNGLSEKHIEQLDTLFPHDRVVALQIHNAIKNREKDVEKAILLSLGAVLFSAMAVLTGVSVIKDMKELPPNGKHILHQVGFVTAVALTLSASSRAFKLAEDFEKTLKSEKNMKEFVVNVQENFYGKSQRYYFSNGVVKQARSVRD